MEEKIKGRNRKESTETLQGKLSSSNVKSQTHFCVLKGNTVDKLMIYPVGNSIIYILVKYFITGQAHSRPCT